MSAENEQEELSTIGTVMPADSLILRKEVGDASVKGEEEVYNCTVHATDFTPLVQSKQTGKYFHLDWDTICKLAVKAGVDDPE